MDYVCIHMIRQNTIRQNWYELGEPPSSLLSDTTPLSLVRQSKVAFAHLCLLGTCLLLLLLLLRLLLFYAASADVCVLCGQINTWYTVCSRFACWAGLFVEIVQNHSHPVIWNIAPVVFQG